MYRAAAKRANERCARGRRYVSARGNKRDGGEEDNALGIGRYWSRAIIQIRFLKLVVARQERKVTEQSRDGILRRTPLKAELCYLQR